METIAFDLTPDGFEIPEDVWDQPGAAVTAPNRTDLAWIDDPENSMITAQAGCRHEPHLMCRACQAQRMQFCTALPNGYKYPSCDLDTGGDPDKDIHVPGCFHRM